MQDSNIHIKLEYQEMIENKRNLLLLEQELLESIGYFKKYQNLRKKEIDLKNKVKNNLLQLKKIMSSFQEHLPKDNSEVKAGKYAKELSPKEIKKVVEKRTVETRENDVEKEINEIRMKLSQLNSGEGL